MKYFFSLLSLFLLFSSCNTYSSKKIYNYKIFSYSSTDDNYETENVVDAKAEADTLSIEYLKGAIKIFGGKNKETILVQQGESELFQGSDGQTIMKFFAPKGADTIKMYLSTPEDDLKISTGAVKLVKIN